MHMERLLYARTKTSKSLQNAATTLLSNAKHPLKLDVLFKKFSYRIRSILCSWAQPHHSVSAGISLSILVLKQPVKFRTKEKRVVLREKTCRYNFT